MPDGIEIIHGDAFVELPKLQAESVDIVFTDAPYVASSLSCYNLLGRQAARVLKRGGYCFAYCGKMFFPDAILQMRRHLTTSGSSTSGT